MKFVGIPWDVLMDLEIFDGIRWNTLGCFDGPGNI